MNFMGRLKPLYVASFAILLGLVFSIRWLQPLFVQKIPYESYVPIRYGTAEPSDDYFYFAHIRKAISGKLLAKEPCLFEDSSRFTPHVSYSASLTFCGMGGMLTQSSEHAYYFDLFFLPLVSFLCSLALAWLLTGNLPFSTMISIHAIVLHSEMNRIPNIMFTNIPLFLVSILLFLVLEKRKDSRPLQITTSVLIGLSTLFSLPNFFIVTGISSTSSIFYFRDKQLRKRLFQIGVASMLIALPGLYLIMRAQKGWATEVLPFAVPPLSQYHGINKEQFYEEIRNFKTPLLVISLFGFRYRRFVAASLFGLLFTYLVLAYGIGTYASGRVFFRGSEILFDVLQQCGYFLIIWRVLIEHELELSPLGYRIALFRLPLKKQLERLHAPLLMAFAIWMTVLSVQDLKRTARNKVALANQFARYHQDKEFKELYRWSNSNNKNTDVALTLDFDLLTNLVVYSPVNTYIPQALLSPAPTQERLLRFYETLRFYGVTPEGLRSLLDQMISHSVFAKPDVPPTEAQKAYLNLVLFYGRYVEQPISEEEKAKIVDDYRALLKEPAKFTYRATMFFVSTRDFPYIQPGSEADRLIRSKEPVFTNPVYRVYRMGANI